MSGAPDTVTRIESTAAPSAIARAEDNTPRTPASDDTPTIDGRAAHARREALIPEAVRGRVAAAVGAPLDASGRLDDELLRSTLACLPRARLLFELLGALGRLELVARCAATSDWLRATDARLLQLALERWPAPKACADGLTVSYGTFMRRVRAARTRDAAPAEAGDDAR